MTLSLAQSLASLPEAARQEALATLTQDQAAAILSDWRFWARPEQLPPRGDWSTWLILAGRGWGKTRAGAEWVRPCARDPAARIALIARTASDVRDVIVEGESGILHVCTDRERPEWNPSRRRLTFPSGAVATTFSADEPDQLRGPQHTHAWADEIAAWRYPETWDQLRFGLRLGEHPQVVATTTPRPTALLRNLIAASGTVVTRGRTAENRVNLAPGVVAELERRYHGTRIGRQELDGELLEDAVGALWTLSGIEAARVTAAPELRRVVVAIDPAVSAEAESDETGIVVAGVGWDGRGYVLEDLSGRRSPDAWARCAVDAFRRHRADRIVAEVNNGGDLVEHTLRVVDPSVPVRKVHASRGKAVRAEPIAALYEQGRVSHVGVLARLEDQLCGWSPETAARSPDRLDALVWALTDLFVQPRAVTATESYYDP